MSVRKNVTVGTSIRPARPGEPNSLAWTTYDSPSYPRRIDGPPLDLEKWGFAWDRHVSQSTVDDEHKSESYYGYNTVIPYWTIALLTAALPTWRGVSIVLERKRARRRNGFEPRLVGERAGPV